MWKFKFCLNNEVWKNQSKFCQNSCQTFERYVEKYPQLQQRTKNFAKWVEGIWERRII